MLSMCSMPTVSVGDKVRIRTEDVPPIDVVVSEVTQKQATITYRGRTTTQKPVKIQADATSVTIGDRRVDSITIL